MTQQARVSHAGACALLLLLLLLLLHPPPARSDASWQQLPTVSDPAGIQKHQALAYGGSFVTIGGCDASGSALSSVYALDASSGAWSARAANIARAWMSASAMAPPLALVFGGTVPATGAFSNVTYVFNMATYAFVEVAVAVAPSARCLHATAAYSSSAIILFGGLSPTGAPLDDLWQYSPSSSSWSQISISGSKPGPRFGHFLVASSSTSPSIYLHGGRVATNIFMSDVWQLSQSSPGTWSWQLLSASSSSQPSLNSLALRPNGLLAGMGSVGSGASIVWVFNPLTRAWYSIPLLPPTPTDFASAIALPLSSSSDAILSIGGGSLILSQGKSSAFLFSFDPCPSGTYSSSGQKPCSLCTVGTFSSSIESVTCSPCPIGMQTPAAGATSSSSCASTCAPGTFSSTGLAPCTPCPVGSYNPFQRSITCLSCPQGYSTVSTSSIYFIQCIPNPSCQPGSYSAVGLEPCTPCPKGWYSTNSSSLACTPCPFGTSTDSISTSTPTCKPLCPIGSSSSTGVLPCTVCPRNWYSNSTGSLACTRCNLGWATSQGNATVGAWSRDLCVSTSACLPGAYSDTGFEDEICRLCPVGSYSVSNASLSCTPCPDFHTTLSVGSTSASSCIPVLASMQGSFDATAVIVGASVGSAFFVMLVAVALVMRRRRVLSQISAEGESVQPPLGLIKFDHVNRKPNDIINVSFFSSFTDDGRAAWQMPEAHAPSPFTVALHPPDVLQLADLDIEDVPGAVPLHSVRRTPSSGFGSQPLGSLPPGISRSGSSRVGVMRRSASGGGVGAAPSNKSPPAPQAQSKAFRIVCARDRIIKRFSVPPTCTFEQFRTACCNSHGITEIAAQQRVALFARGTEETRVDSDANLQLALQRGLDGIVEVILWAV